MPRVTYNGDSLALNDGQTVLDALLDRAHAIPNSCRSGACQSCLMQATDGQPPAQAQAGLKATQVRQGYFLACQCTPVEDMTVQLPGADMRPVPAAVTARRLLSPQVLELTLRPASDYPYQAGQFCTLTRDDGLCRSYSLASVPTLGRELIFHIRRVPGGRFSNWVFDSLSEGDILRVHPAAGDCVYVSEEPDADLLLVGTATGLAPLIGIARDALAQGHAGDIHLLHGAMDADGLYLREELHELAARHANLHYQATVLKNDDGRDIPTGDIAGLATERARQLASPRAYLCGAPDFVQGLRKKLFLGGMSNQRIHADAFLPAASPAS